MGSYDEIEVLTKVVFILFCWNIALTLAFLIFGISTL